MRASIIDRYQQITDDIPNLFNSRLDYEQIKRQSETEASITVFTELRSVRRISGDRALIRIGSQQQPFDLFIPDVTSSEAQALLNLLKNRYISGDNLRPRRSYAYVTGELSQFNG